MILTTHAIIGAALARTIPNHPLIGFFLGVAGHLLLDTVPHWQYPLRSVQKEKGIVGHRKLTKGRALIGDFLLVGTDALIGILLGWFIFPPILGMGTWTSILTIFGSLLPDGLTFLYVWGWHSTPLAHFRKLHLWFHAEDRSLEEKPLIGIPLQILVIIILILALQLV